MIGINIIAIKNCDNIGKINANKTETNLFSLIGIFDISLLSLLKKFKIIPPK